MIENTVGYTESNTFRCLEDLDNANPMRTMSPLNLSYCGKEGCVSGWTFGPYVRDNYVIHVVTGGKGIYRTGGREYRISAGQMFVIYPGEETIYQADSQNPWSYMWIGFCGFNAAAIVEKIGFRKNDPVITLDNVYEIGVAIDRMLDAKQLTPVNELKRMAALYDALALMMQNTKCSGSEVNHSEISYVSMAIKLIAESYNTNIKISEIADKVGINRSYFSNIFKREMKISPQEFLINFRLEKAAQMLRETNDSIGSIAAAVGYSDALAFSKAFKHKYTVSPREFRQAAPALAHISQRGSYQGTSNL